MPQSETQAWIRREVSGLALLAGSTYLLMSLASFSFDPGAGRNLGGPVGDSLANVLRQSVGLAAFLLPLYGLLAGTQLVRNRPLGASASRIAGGAALLLFAAILLSLLFPRWDVYRSGGAAGGWVAHKLFREELGVMGAYLFTFAGLALALAFALDVSVLALGRRLAILVRAMPARIQTLRERRAARRGAPPEPPGVRRAPEIPAHVPSRRQIAEAATEPAAAKKAPPVIVPKAVQEKFEFVREAHAGPGPYQLPPLDFLNPPIATGASLDKETLITNSHILEKKLKDFGVEGNVVKVNPGPIVTMFEFEPAAGVKISRIVKLSDDLMMALRADSVRIVGPLPGKAVVGIEVSNRDRERVCLKEMIASHEFQTSVSKLTLSLGKDIFGAPIVAPLESMPHLLVAGATGTGKSVFLNSVLMSILYRCTPEECRLLLIDPKLLELSVYEGIPHLLTQVVTNPKRAAAALQGIVHKMEERNRLMAAKGVRNIDQYNRRMEKEAKEAKEGTPPEPVFVDGEAVEFPRRLPYIVVMIDELADLMVVAGRDVEESLTRLAQMARAAGIHLVLATQRPSVDVLTGVIKANFPTRVSFQVFGKVDSRSILDQHGAETLLGMGDMLYVPPNTSKLRRIHGAYVSEDEIRRVVEFLKDQGAPTYDETIIRAKEETSAVEDEEADEVYDQAVAVVTEYRQASISFIQRKLRVGYNRAARIMERMERDGVVGPADGTNRREVLVRDLSDGGYE